MRIASYHLHTNFCDGINTPEEMVIAAINAGMTDLGFSAHAAWPFTAEWHLQPERYKEYIAEIARLKNAYADQITLLCGFEADYIYGVTYPDSTIYSRFSPDFLIGSVHYVAPPFKGKPENLWCVDAPTEDVAQGIAQGFKHDGRRAVEAYWSTVRDMVTSCDFDIIGHLDVLRKRNGVLHFFDETASWYRKEINLTAKVIAHSGKIVELNTGGMARKAIDSVYPSDELLARLNKHGVPITISSDAHNSEHLIFAYETAKAAAKKAGYTTLTYKNGANWQQEKFL